MSTICRTFRLICHELCNINDNRLILFSILKHFSYLMAVTFIYFQLVNIFLYIAIKSHQTATYHGGVYDKICPDFIGNYWHSSTVLSITTYD
jgi:hypothetical protein